MMASIIKYGVKLLINFQTSAAQPLKFGKSISHSIPYSTGHVITYLCLDSIFAMLVKGATEVFY